MECAIVLPVTFFLLFSLFVGALGIFRYQEVATLAREGARYASTHGYQYRKDAGLKTRAIAEILSAATWQRCRVHFMRNLLATVPKSAADAVAAVVRTIFAQRTHAEGCCPPRGTNS